MALVTSLGIPHTPEKLSISPGSPSSETDYWLKNYTGRRNILNEMAGVFDLELHDEPEDQEDLSDDDCIEVEDRVEVGVPPF